MEVSALKHTGGIGLRGPTPLLRLQSDERLIVLVRRGNQAAFEALVGRYQARLLAFCRHMLASREDAEDVLQEVFAAAFNAILADDRPINVRPWLYRIARNRSLNHLRRRQAIGVDSMDIHFAEGGATTADKVHEREEFRLLIADVQDLPETQKTALLLREIDALSYEQIADAMETTIPSVKSLLVRARVSLAEAAEARQLTCGEVREELGEVAEGLRRTSAPARRHLRSCERCQGFRTQLRSTNKALAAVFPVAPLLLFKKALLAQFGMTASAGAGSAAGAAAAGVAATGGTTAMTAGISTIATKAAAGLAAAAIVTAGAVEVKQVQHAPAHSAVAAATASPAGARAPAIASSTPQPEAPAAVQATNSATMSTVPTPHQLAEMTAAEPAQSSTPIETLTPVNGAVPTSTTTPDGISVASAPVNPTQVKTETTTLPAANAGAPPSDTIVVPPGGQPATVPSSPQSPPVAGGVVPLPSTTTPPAPVAPTVQQPAVPDGEAIADAVSRRIAAIQG